MAGGVLALLAAGRDGAVGRNARICAAETKQRSRKQTQLTNAEIQCAAGKKKRRARNRKIRSARSRNRNRARLEGKGGKAAQPVPCCSPSSLVLVASKSRLSDFSQETSHALASRGFSPDRPDGQAVRYHCRATWAGSVFVARDACAACGSLVADYGRVDKTCSGPKWRWRWVFVRAAPLSVASRGP